MSNTKDGSVAPKERINIRYVPKADGLSSEVELPLNLLVVGDMKGRPEDAPIDERSSVSVNKNNFNSVMSETGISLNFSVENSLSDKKSEDIQVEIDIKGMEDFSPDNIVKQVPELRKLLELREALVALKGPMGNVPAFRTQLQALLDQEESRMQLLKELDIVNKA
ncbi:type VI secretion system contractile sheath small subunit [Rahnella sp. PCH160]|uniref:type VI secretion system contractile sheath small subunit n=1 Tax=Rahnella sp. PCH160 TaxID=3447928 RepID=UPI0039FBBD90